MNKILVQLLFVSLLVLGCNNPTPVETDDDGGGSYTPPTLGTVTAKITVSRQDNGVAIPGATVKVIIDSDASRLYTNATDANGFVEVKQDTYCDWVYVSIWEVSANGYITKGASELPQSVVLYKNQTYTYGVTLVLSK